MAEDSDLKGWLGRIMRLGASLASSETDVARLEAKLDLVQDQLDLARSARDELLEELEEVRAAGSEGEVERSWSKRVEDVLLYSGTVCTAQDVARILNTDKIPNVRTTLARLASDDSSPVRRVRRGEYTLSGPAPEFSEPDMMMAWKLAKAEAQADAMPAEVQTILIENSSATRRKKPSATALLASAGLIAGAALAEKARKS